MIKNNIQSRYIKNNFDEKFRKKFKNIFSKIKEDFFKSDKTLNVLNSKFDFNIEFKDLKRFKNFKTIALVGMGGSILGAEAIYHLFKNKIKKNIFFFNDLNENELINFKKKNNLSNVLFIIISKSGNTIETLSNFFLLNILKKKSKNIIIISERKNNYLYSLAKEFDLFFIEHKHYIGGRNSVLSEVGLVPVYLMGVNISKLRLKTEKYLNKKNIIILKDSVLKLSNLMLSKKINNIIFLNYVPELEKFLYWYQQLLAESLGKKNKGFLPVISNVPKDHHSLLQLYLDGPKDKLFYIFSIGKKSKNNINLKGDKNFQSILNKKKISTVKNAQKDALIKSFYKKNIPFREFKFKILNEEILGEMISYFILETVLVGKLSSINPFDQPAVEQVKNYTKQILKQKNRK